MKYVREATFIIIFIEHRDDDHMTYDTTKGKVSKKYSLLMEPQKGMKITLYDNSTFWINTIHQDLKRDTIEVIEYRKIPFYKNRNNEIKQTLINYEDMGWKIEQV